MKRFAVLALAVLAACGGNSPASPTSFPNLAAGDWEFFQDIPRQGGGVNSWDTGFRLTFQQTEGSLNATFTQNTDPTVTLSGTGSVAADRAFTLHAFPGVGCDFAGTVDSSVTAITGNYTCPENNYTVGFTFRRR